MAGPDQTGLVPRLQAMAAAAGVAGRVSWPGMLRGDAKWGAFYAAEMFALPSHQENFGIAVAEALGCGLPALISDKVNIWREVAADGAGIVASDTLAGTRQSLRQWLNLRPEQRAEFRQRAATTFMRRYTVDAMCHSLIDAVSSDHRHKRPARAATSRPRSSRSWLGCPQAGCSIWARATAHSAPSCQR